MDWTDAGASMAERVKRSSKTASGVSRTYGTVSAVNSDSTVDVVVAGAVLEGLRYTTACSGMAAGDRCLVDTYDHRSIVTGILA